MGSQLLLRYKMIEQPIEQEVQDQIQEITQQSADFFNGDENFQEAVAGLFEVGQWLMGVKAIASPMHVMMLMGAKVHKLRFRAGEIFRVVEDQDFIKKEFPQDKKEKKTESAAADEAVLTKTLAAAGQICILRDDWDAKDDGECFKVDTYKTPQENLTRWEMQPDFNGKSWDALIAAAEAERGDPS